MAPPGKALGFIVSLLILAAMSAAHAGEKEQEQARHLVSVSSCNACHQAKADTFLPPRRGPVLDGVGSRLQAEWIRQFLNDPVKTKPGTRMPDMLQHLGAGDIRAEAAENLVHFLMSRPGEPAPALRHCDPVGGANLYRSIGCVACHGTDKPAVKGKYSFASLTAFLFDPLKTHPDGRMPSLQLTRDHATDVAGYLLDMEPGRPPPQSARFRPETERVNAGRNLFTKLNCAACHDRSDAGPSAPKRAWPHRDDGKWECAGPPRYTFTTGEQQALSRHLGHLPLLTPRLRIAGILSALNCYACHARDGTGGPSPDGQEFFTGDETLGNDGRFPPHLTGAGAKLTRQWMKAVLEGKGRLRPYLNVRMPVFGKANTDPLPSLLEDADGPASRKPGKGDVEAGRKLMGLNGGMGCITCHGWETNPGVAMRALNLSGATERLRFDWFWRYLINPQKERPGTLMPSFWPGGRSGNPGVLSGDTEAQIAAVWSFLKEGRSAPEGFPDPGSTEFEIVPKKHVVVQRGFMPGVGAYAIAVGSRHGVHYVFDAEHCRVARVWTGRFIDGYKVWFSRMDPTMKPLGETVDLDLPPALEGEARFRGYRLDPESGVPTFLYTVGEARVTETVTPLATQKLRREITTESDGEIIRADGRTYTW